MAEAFICAYKRTPIGRYGGALASVRTDDLAAHVIKAVLQDCSDLDPAAVDDVIMGATNQAGEDNRNVARMALLLAGLPDTIAGVTHNRLCGSGLDAVIAAARAIKAGEADLIIAGGVESMSRAPLVMPKAETAFSRSAEIHDTTIGWRFINPIMAERYGVDQMPETAENLAQEDGISRADQDRFALWSQEKAASAQASGRLAREISPVSIAARRGDAKIVDQDEHPRATSLEKLSSLKAPFRASDGSGGVVTAGNASGVNDGAAALVIASEKAIKAHDLTPLARIVGGAVAGVPPRIMGAGPVPATQKLLARIGLGLDDIDLIELNEAFAAQALSVTRRLGLEDQDPRVTPHGGAIALGHPTGMSGARLAGSCALDIADGQAKRALATMCIGVGQGIAAVLERV